MLTTSDKGLNVIKAFEGSALRAYKDSVHVWTIGYGLTNYDKGLPWVIQEGLVITQAEAEKWLPKSLSDNYEPDVRAAMKDPSQAQFDAGASFHYNTGAIKKASWPQALARGDKTGARTSLLSWNHAGGTILAGLTRRRKREWAMCDSGDYGPEGTAKPAAVTHNEDGTPAPQTAPGSGMLGLHNTGHDVTELQSNLELLGLLRAAPRSTFDPDTEKAVRAFQASHKQLSVDGVVGPATRSAIERDVASRRKVGSIAKLVAISTVPIAGTWKAVGYDTAKILADFTGVLVLALTVYVVLRYRDEISARVNRLLGREVP